MSSGKKRLAVLIMNAALNVAQAITERVENIHIDWLISY